MIFNKFYFHGFQIFLYCFVRLFSDEVEMAHISLVDVPGYALEVKVYTLHSLHHTALDPAPPNPLFP